MKEERVSKIAGNLTASPKESFEVIVDYLDMHVEEDNFEKGVSGRMMEVYSKSNFGRFDSVDQAIKAVASFFDVEARWFDLDDSEEGILNSGWYMVDADNQNRNDDKRFLEQFEKGEVRAWQALITFSIRFAKVWTPSDNEIKAQSGIV